MLSPSPGFMPPPSPSSRTARHKAKRSITDINSPARPKGHLSRHSLQHNLRKDKLLQDDRDTQARSRQRSLDMPRPDMLARSRRNSSLVAQIEETGSRSSSNQLPLEPKVSRASKGEMLRKERETAARRAEDLKQSLVHLHTFSTNASRRLDQTYYAVLEKMSALQNTISALSDLADNSREIYRTFEKDSRGLETDITNQLDALGHFDEQQKKVEGLQARIDAGRARVQALSSRVDAVRERVESWERADQSWQEKTRRRLKYIWMIMTTVSLIITVLFLTFRYGMSESPLAALDEIVASAADIPKHGRPNVLDATPPVHEEIGSRMHEPLFWTSTVRHDDRLRGLDEL